MIGKVTGRVDYIAEDHVLIDTGALGYVVHCGPGTLRALPEPGGPVALYTEFVVREDTQQLYGFLTVGDREWHRLLTSVQGVGARVAIGVLDALGQSGLSRALAAGDAQAIRAAPGVGPKLATRIVTELKGKAPTMMAMGARGARTTMPVAQGSTSEGEAAPQPPMAATTPGPDAVAMEAAAAALSALVNLGYDRTEASEAVAGAGADGASNEGALIKAALRLLDRTD